MVDLVLSLPDLLGAAAMMAFTTAAGLAVYLLAASFISRYRSADLKDPTSSVFRVVGMLVALMLSLSFADVIVKSHAIDNAIGREVVALADTFHDLQAFDREGTREIRSLIIDYAEAVVADDWPALADERLGEQTSAVKQQLIERIYDLKPEAPFQEMLWSRILADIDAVSDNRLLRLDSALADPPVFVYIVLLGFFVTMACFGAYPPSVPLIGLTTLYTLFIGFVLYLVLSLSEPYTGWFGVEPTDFKSLADILRAEDA